jgi:4-hydroxy-4-methyl-2-oxoglutarate aldolase
MDTTSAEYYDLVESKLYTSGLADVMDDLDRRNQTLPHHIRPIYDGAKVVGRAATMSTVEVDTVPAEPHKLLLELLDSLEPGEVVVCTTRGSMHAAVWGELLSTHARSRGGRGAIIDGPTRDSWGIVDMRFPVFASGLTPADSKGRIEVTEIRVPIEVGGVSVRDGDLVVGDRDGCVVVPQEIESDVVEQAIAKVEAEDTVRELLREGASIRSVFKEHRIL